MVSSVQGLRVPVSESRESRYPGPLVLTLVWTLVGSLAYARHYLQDPAVNSVETRVYEFLIWLTCYYPWIAFSPVVFALEKRHPIGKERWYSSFAWLAGACVPLCYLAAQTSQVLSAGLAMAFHRPVKLWSPWWIPSSCEICIQLGIYGVSVLGTYVIRNLIQLHESERAADRLALEKAELESSLRQAELETLRMRLNPHFLFNCLQNIAVLTEEDPRTANQMLTRLGDLLRTALRRETSAEMTLAAEIALTKSYTAIEKMRFEDRLSILFNIAPESERALVPAFLLQPLVENAILHGLRGVRRDGVITISSEVDGENLTITIRDNGIGLPVGEGVNLEPGIGLSSTCARLEKMYPQQHSFSIRSLLPEGGAEVRVTLPLHFENNDVGVAVYEQASPVGR